jgi:hypothetical protein
MRGEILYARCKQGFGVELMRRAFKWKPELNEWSPYSSGLPNSSGSFAKSQLFVAPRCA